MMGLLGEEAVQAQGPLAQVQDLQQHEQKGKGGQGLLCVSVIHCTHITQHHSLNHTHNPTPRSEVVLNAISQPVQIRTN